MYSVCTTLGVLFIVEDLFHYLPGYSAQDILRGSSSLVMQFLFWLISLCFLSHSLATPIQNQVAKRNQDGQQVVRITNSKITKVEDITDKEHEIVMFDTTTGTSKGEGVSLDNERIQFLSERYKSMKLWDGDTDRPPFAEYSVG